MKRREFLSALSVVSAAGLSGCGLLNIDPYSVYLRSDSIETPEQEHRIVSKAKLDWTSDGRIRVIYLRGSPYERGYQQGALLGAEIRDNLNFLYDGAISKFHFKELFSEAFERARPFISEEYMQEMHGLAHGSKLPLELIHHIHILPEIGEWGGKRRIKEVVKAMMNGELGTSCSNFCAYGKATSDGNFYTVRILDWGLHRISKLHKYPLIAVHFPEHGQAYANIGWMGFLGAISGMNASGITLGEMGYGNPPGESLSGKPMAFLLRDVLSQARSLTEVRNLISNSVGTNSYIFLMADGKAREAEIYIRDRNRFVVVKPGQSLQDKDNNLPAIDSVLYGGHYHDRMTELLNSYHGKLTPENMMREVIPAMVMPSNFQNVVYDPVRLQFWVANASGPGDRAAEQAYSFFDLQKALTSFGEVATPAT